MNREKIMTLVKKCLRFLPDRRYIKLYYQMRVGQKLNMDNPITLNEKLQWLKFNYRFPLQTVVSDKLLVRDYVKEKIGEKYLIPLLGSWEKYSDIDFSKLPNKFVLKCNHGCAYNILCADKSSFDKEDAIKKMKKWMKEDFGAFNIEKHYSKIVPHITCEEYLGECITDYKFFCFNGEPKYIYVSSDLIHDRQAQIGFFYLDGTKMPLIRDDYAPMNIEELPPFFENMKKDAEVLCEDFPFVRVDFFVANNTYYFAKLTFTPSGGMMPFNPDKYDLKWGENLDISINIK